MSGDSDDFRWTSETLYAHFLALMEERDRRYDQRFIDQERVLNQFMVIARDKFASQNEFRQALTDQTATCITRKEAESAIQRNTDRIQELNLLIRDLVPKTELIHTYELVDARLQRIETFVSASEGKSSGLSSGWGYLVAVIGLLIGIATIALAIHNYIAVSK